MEKFWAAEWWRFWSGETAYVCGVRFAHDDVEDGNVAARFARLTRDHLILSAASSRRMTSRTVVLRTVFAASTLSPVKGV